MIPARHHHIAPLLISIAVITALPPIADAQQSGRIEGIVLDTESRTPLIAVNIFLKTLRNGTFTDREGRFRLVNLPALEDYLIVSHIGHQTKEIPVTLAAGGIEHLEILLDPHRIDMEHVVVTGHRRSVSEFRTEKAVTVTGESAIATRPAGSTADALREVTGVLIQKTTAGHGTPIIRGLIGKNIVLLYNGVRLNKPTFRSGGNQYLSTIDAEALTRIEVVRGPGSVLYGSDAVGGMVNTITHPPSFTDGEVHWMPRVRFRFTSADMGQGIHLGMERAGPSVSARLGITARSLGNLNPGGAIPVHDPTGYDEAGGHAIVAFKLSEQQTLRCDLLQLTQNEVPRFDQYANGSHQTYLYDPQKRFLGMVEYTHRNPTVWLNSLQWNISWQREHEGRIQRRIVDGAPSAKLRVDDDTITTLGTFIQATSLAASRHALRWGLEYYHDRLSSGRTETTVDTTIVKRGAYPDDSRFRQMGIFLSDDIILSPWTDLTAGLRFSNIWYRAHLEPPYGLTVNSFSNLTGNIGISHRLRPWLNLLASFSRGFRAPNFNDTVVLKTSSNWVDAPNPDLEPELSTNLEFGTKMEWNHNDVEAFVYYTSLENIIDRRPGMYDGLPYLDENENGVPDPGEPEIKVKENLGDAYITGAELQGLLHLGERWSVRGNVFYTYGQNATADEPMSRIPPLMGLAGIKWQREETTAEIFVRAGGAQHRLSTRDDDDSRIDPGGTPGWTDWNIRGRRTFGPVSLDITFGNIFDHAYKEHGSGVYNPGRHLVLAVSWTTSRW